VDATEPAFLDVRFIAGSEDESVERSLRIPNWPSDDALLLVFFQ